VTASVLAAFAHIGGQILVARAWLVPHDGVFFLVPMFAAAALLLRDDQRADRGASSGGAAHSRIPP
jgi:hypothetical protein